MSTVEITPPRQERGTPEIEANVRPILEWVLTSIGGIAGEVDRVIETTGAAVAAINARGDRIDRIQAQNRVAIAELLGDTAV
jgi:hypothetical protein